LANDVAGNLISETITFRLSIDEPGGFFKLKMQTYLLAVSFGHLLLAPSNSKWTKPGAPNF